MASRSVDAQFIVPAPPTIVEDTRQERFVHEEHVLAVQRNRLTADKAMRIAALFAVLSDPTRLQVVYALLQAPTGELCVGDLATGLHFTSTACFTQPANCSRAQSWARSVLPAG